MTDAVADQLRSWYSASRFHASTDAKTKQDARGAQSWQDARISLISTRREPRPRRGVRRLPRARAADASQTAVPPPKATAGRSPREGAPLRAGGTPRRRDPAQRERPKPPSATTAAGAARLPRTRARTSSRRPGARRQKAPASSGVAAATRPVRTSCSRRSSRQAPRPGRKAREKLPAQRSTRVRWVPPSARRLACSARRRRGL